MDNEDRKLEETLAAYRVEDARPALHAKIMRAAAATPQQPAPWTAVLLDRLASLPWWQKEAAAFALVALLGFWIGSLAPGYSMAQTQQTYVSSENGASDSTSLGKIIFGPTSFKEVNI